MNNRYLTYLFVLCLFGSSRLMAQDAFISGLDRTSASFGEIVTINGKGFGTNAGNLRVFFGGALATIVSADETIIEVQVPANATYDHVSVINTANNIHVTSPEKFVLSHSGDTFDTDLLTAQDQNSTAGLGVFDFCACDFNMNGSMDYIVSNSTARSGALGEFSIFTNSSTPGTISLSRQNISIDELAYTDCGDLNGDGLPDLIFSEGGGQNTRVYVFENTTSGSNISFNSPIILPLPLDALGEVRIVDRLIMQDLDRNGKVDIIVANTTNNELDIFENTSSGGTMSFNTAPIQITLEADLVSSGLDAQDMNNDGFPEIIVTPSAEENVFIFPNSSDIGDIKFDDFIRLDQTGNLSNVRAADLNGDGFADLIAIDGGVLGGAGRDFDEVHVFVNTTSTPGGAITMEKNTTFLVNENPESIGFGDLNGDGKIDGVVTSRTSIAGSGITVLINTTTAVSVGFDIFEIATPSSSRSPMITDVDNDGRPDIVFTHDVGVNNAGDLSVILNKNCILPEITPDQSQIICANNDLEIQATQSNGSTYRWERSLNGGAFSVIQESDVSFINAQSFISPGDVGEFRVTLITESGTCSNTSNSVEIRINSDTVNPPVLSSNGPVCAGTALQLSSNIASSAVIYQWTGPDGFVSSEATPEITDFQLQNAGRYELVISSGSCVSAAGSIVVGSRTLPFTAIDNDGEGIICEGTDKTLSVTDFGGSFTYQWRRDGVDVTTAGTGNTTFTTSTAGNYTVLIDDGTGCQRETPVSVLETIAPPTASIDAISEICVDIPAVFIATSNGDSRFTIVNEWDFDDGTTISGGSVNHSYTDGGVYNVTLTSSYQEIAACSNVAQVAFTAREIPTIPITAPDNTAFEKCPSDSIRLELPNNFLSYEWENGDNTFFTFGKTGKDLDEGTISVNWIDDAGCASSSEVNFSNFANSRLTITSSFDIDNDTITLGEDVQSVDLSVGFGTDLSWTPVDVIENSTSSDVTVFPSRAFTSIIAEATTTNNCRESDTVVLVNNFLIPRRTFSPNGDGAGFECWEILNARILDACTVYIFDSKGVIIQEVSSPFDDDNCIWDGTTQGRPAPEGVYYYVLKCNDTDFNRSGSILLAR